MNDYKCSICNKQAKTGNGRQALCQNCIDFLRLYSGHSIEGHMAAHWQAAAKTAKRLEFYLASNGYDYADN